MFKLKNTVTGKCIKNMIDGKTMLFSTEADALAFGDSIHRDSLLSATAWNRKRGFSYVVVKG